MTSADRAASRRARMMERTDVVCLGWWADGGPLVSESGLRQVLDLLHEVLPEAVPSRWGVTEDYRYRLVDEGLAGLVAFVDSHRWQVLLRGKSPARRIDLYPVPLSQKDGELRVTCFQVELDASVLDKKGAGARLPEAFEQIGAAIEPFYGEARFLRGVAKYEGSPLRFHPSVEVYPFQWNGWWGLPVKAPFAAMIGRGYRELWPDFASSSPGDLAVENPSPWHRDMEQLAWQVPPGLCQVCDLHWSEMDLGASGLFGPPGVTVELPPGLLRGGFQRVAPTVRPPEWPFQAGRLGRTPDQLVGLAEVPRATGDGEIRQVTTDDADGEPFEAWERLMPGRPGLFSIWVNRTPDPDWPWKLTIAALEFVRSEPLEGRLRGALKAALQGLPGVTAVTEDDREVLLLAGSPTGFEIIEAATRTIDTFAVAIQKHHDNGA